MDMAALSALHFTTVRRQELRIFASGLQMDVSALVCAAACYVCWQELRIFASGLGLSGYVFYVRWQELRVFASWLFALTMDMAAQSCAAVPYVCRQDIRTFCLWFADGCFCAVCAAARYVCRQDVRTFASGSTFKMDMAALSALQLTTFVSRTLVPLPLVILSRWLRCLRCSSLRSSTGASYLCLWFADGCFCAVCAAAC